MVRPRTTPPRERIRVPAVRAILWNVRGVVERGEREVGRGRGGLNRWGGRGEVLFDFGEVARPDLGRR